MLPVIRHALGGAGRGGWTPDSWCCCSRRRRCGARAHRRRRRAACASRRRLGGHRRRGAEAPVARLRDADRGWRAAALPARGRARDPPAGRAARLFARRHGLRVPARHARSLRKHLRRRTACRWSSTRGVAVDRFAGRLGRGGRGCWDAKCRVNGSSPPGAAAVRRGISARWPRCRPRGSSAISPRSPRARDDRRRPLARRGRLRAALLGAVPALVRRAVPLAPERLLVVSRGGTAAWYRPFAANYRETFDYLTPEEFRRRHDERVAANGEQKQTQVLAFERELLRRAHRGRRAPLDAASVEHVRAVQPVLVEPRRRIAGCTRMPATRASSPPPAGLPLPAAPYTAVKFYFNDCFPATDANRAFVRGVSAPRCGAARSCRSPPACASTITTATSGSAGVQPLPPPLHPRDNLALQSAIVAGARGLRRHLRRLLVPGAVSRRAATAYYSNAAGFSQRHLAMARSAFASIGAGPARSCARRGRASLTLTIHDQETS